MESKAFNLIRFDAKEGYLFDWLEPRFIEDEDGKQIRERLLVKTLFIGGNDSIANYIEVPAEVI
jgi:hypothetical protein